jgi:hypothetical protein
MLRQPTVIVVGAGAGVDIDMPVGSVLSGTIASKLNIRFDAGQRVSGDDIIADALRRVAKERGDNFNEWRAAACAVASGRLSKKSLYLVVMMPIRSRRAIPGQEKSKNSRRENAKSFG